MADTAHHPSSPSGDEPKPGENGGIEAPPAPMNVQECGVAPQLLLDLALKTVYRVHQFSTDWAVKQLCLPLSIVSELLKELRQDKVIDFRGEDSPFDYRCAITERGREQCRRLFELSSYVGPAPVSLPAYVEMLDRYYAALPTVTPQDIARALEGLVLPGPTIEVASLAVAARRSLLLFGPPGNGKTSLGRALHCALAGRLWIPHCIVIEGAIIRLFDPQIHSPVGPGMASGEMIRVDRRWVCIQPPFTMVGGELRIEDLDLHARPGSGYYEAPIHMKSNGGAFMLDDFGCQREDPQRLLNRWIVPLENSIDYLTLPTGQKIEVPFRQMLIISTNLEPTEVLAPGMLRRLGYRLRLDNPTSDAYATIFRRFAAQLERETSDDLIGWLIQRYADEERPLRACQPRDLIERVRDICRFRGQRFELSKENLDLAWRGYFGEQDESAASG